MGKPGGKEEGQRRDKEGGERGGRYAILLPTFPNEFIAAFLRPRFSSRGFVRAAFLHCHGPTSVASASARLSPARNFARLGVRAPSIRRNPRESSETRRSRGAEAPVRFREARRPKSKGTRN